jgi:hypothetical protein
MPLLNRKSTTVSPGPLSGMYSSPRSVGAPVLDRLSTRTGPVERLRSGLFETCAHPGCRSGWLHLWRSRSAPVFEQGWTCSPACTEARIAAAVARELDGRTGVARVSHRHRVPLGLLMLEQGSITHAQLRRALEAQKAAGTGRLGQWLIGQHAVTEEQVTRALGLQWSCPVLSLEHHDPAAMTDIMPRLFVDAFGALPLRLAAGRVLYLGFEEALDPVLALALERMIGLRVESGVVIGSQFHQAHSRLLEAQFPPIELIEAVSQSAAAHVLARSLEKARPGAARLVRVHDCLWLRMSERGATASSSHQASGWVRDVVCSIGL